MIKRFGWIAALLLALIPAACLAQIDMVQLEDSASGSTLMMFEWAQDSAVSDMTRMAVEMQIEARFAQKAAREAVGRAGVQIRQAGALYEDERIVSMARTWQGTQQNGREGSSAAALTIDLATGMEIYLDELFADAEGAVAAMEAIIERDVLEGMSDYMAFADLLPMPTGSFFVDESGLTIYYPEERYRYFSGESGSVTFAWHEIDAFIGEESPVYALSRPKEQDVNVLGAAVAAGTLVDLPALGTRLEEVAQAYALSDPDYTPISLVYPFERMRGVSVEIDRYAETDRSDTPVSAVRAACIDFYGLTTGETTKEQILAALGEPAQTVRYDEDDAADMLLEAGESLFYVYGGRVLQAHMDEDDVLRCVILREEIPEWYY